jgi:hypothetical protein
MEKNWLIRTKTNHILGPVSKEKVLELYHNGSIKAEDEVCSGNGYWFYVRENDLVERFLIGTEVQTFNPISEAKDVLTTRTAQNTIHEDDITMVAGFSVSGLKKSSSAEPPQEEIAETTDNGDATGAEPKKKNRITPRLKTNSGTRVIKSPQKQAWLKYLAILIFALVFIMIYKRQTVMDYIFNEEISFSLQMIDMAVAQEDVPAKKKLLESEIVLEKVIWKPFVGLDGFQVRASFDIEQLNCVDLNNDIYQLAVMLYPEENINEKFLIKLRDCVLKLPKDHPMNRWMKSLAAVKPLTEKDQKSSKFLEEIINSQFNLITDMKVKAEIISILDSLPFNTIPEQILRSYLYLMIGNIARSDNILKEIAGSPPRVNWEKSGKPYSLYHKIAMSNVKQIFRKLGNHPADREMFQIFCLYLQTFMNDENLLTILDDTDTSGVEKKMGLKITETLAPSFVHYLRLTNLSENQRIRVLRSSTYPLDEQSYWFWAFLDIDPLVSDSMLPELMRLEKDDQLWFVYLLDNEKLGDLLSTKNGKSFLPGRRPFLKEGLNENQSFMMSLYKLIELGDINQNLVHKTSDYLIQ